MIRAALGQREEDDGTSCRVGAAAAAAARRQAIWIALWSVVLAAAGAIAAWAIGRWVAG